MQGFRQINMSLMSEGISQPKMGQKGVKKGSKSCRKISYFELARLISLEWIKINT